MLQRRWGRETWSPRYSVTATVSPRPACPGGATSWRWQERLPWTGVRPSPDRRPACISAGWRTNTASPRSLSLSTSCTNQHVGFTTEKWFLVLLVIRCSANNIKRCNLLTSPLKMLRMSFKLKLFSIKCHQMHFLKTPICFKIQSVSVSLNDRNSRWHTLLTSTWGANTHLPSWGKPRSRTGQLDIINCFSISYFLECWVSLGKTGLNIWRSEN